MLLSNNNKTINPNSPNPSNETNDLRIINEGHSMLVQREKQTHILDLAETWYICTKYVVIELS